MIFAKIENKNRNLTQRSDQRNDMPYEDELPNEYNRMNSLDTINYNTIAQLRLRYLFRSISNKSSRSLKQ
jgi:hypothetical protein